MPLVLFSPAAISEDAQDPLELEENYIIQQLNTEMPPQYDIYSQ